jgi:serine/threonine protein phosphatase PrpC
MSDAQLQVRIGHASERGRRESNDDYVAAEESGGARGMREVVAAIADGVSGPGARLAAETVVRGFLDGYLSQPPTLSVERAASRVLESLNRWVYSQSRRDAEAAGMATTFTALVLRGRRAHVAHVGDSRLYQLRGGELRLLTRDHCHSHPDMSHVLVRAVGLDEAVRVDYAQHDLKPHDRFVLCTDGVYATLGPARLASLLVPAAAPEEAARRVVEAALAAGSQDNATALVLDVITVPGVDRLDLEASLAELPILELPRVGETIDGFHLTEVISDGRYSRLYRAEDTREPRAVIVKFPHPRVAADNTYRRAFLREAWIASQASSPFVGEVIELPAGRQSRLYSVMPFYDGETLEKRLKRSPVSLEEGVRIGIALGKAVYALNRRHIIHRDVKPENVLLSRGGGLKLVDLGVARLPGLEATADEEIPGTPSYMAPELFDGQAGDERSDVYALGATLYRMFTGGHYPYGEVEAFSRPRFNKRTPLESHRPDLPAWLDVVLARATALAPEARHTDAMELALELEHDLARGPRALPPRASLYERNPLRFWQIVSLLLFLALIASLAF